MHTKYMFILIFYILSNMAAFHLYPQGQIQQL